MQVLKHLNLNSIDVGEVLAVHDAERCDVAALVLEKVLALDEIRDRTDAVDCVVAELFSLFIVLFSGCISIKVSLWARSADWSTKRTSKCSLGMHIGVHL